MLIDSESTCSLISNAKLATNIRKVKETLTINTYGGKTSTNMKCDVHGWGTSLYHPGGIANILALHEVAKKWRVTFDSQGGNAFIVHKKD
eukprot:6246377-Ditylum_brightwellii.AAC.1